MNAQVAAYVRGWMRGRFTLELRLANPYYAALPMFSPEAYCYRLAFERGRDRLRERIREGREQPPGSVYDPDLDDGQGALTYCDVKGAA